MPPTQHVNNISHHQHSAIQSPSEGPLGHPRVSRAAAAKARPGRETQSNSRYLVPSTTQGCWDQRILTVPQSLCHQPGLTSLPSLATACTDMHPVPHANEPEGREFGLSSSGSSNPPGQLVLSCCCSLTGCTFLSQAHKSCPTAPWHRSGHHSEAMTSANPMAAT